MERKPLAESLASGVAGWFQLQAAQNLHSMSGEDSVRTIAAQVVNAQGRFSPAKSQQPNNWKPSKQRVDIALRGRGKDAKGWYGAVELKWAGASFDPDQMRLDLVQDSMRLAFIDTTNLNAKFLLLGGATESLEKLLKTPHPDSTDRESRRLSFNELFKTDPKDPKGELDHASWSASFPEAGARVPELVFDSFDGKLRTTLLASASAAVGGTEIGAVYVWQCNKVRGKG